MPAATAETVLDTLRGMPRSEVDDVRKRIAAFMSFGEWGGAATEAAHEQENTPPDARRVYRIVAEEMQAAGLADMRDLHYGRLKNRRSFADKSERLVAFLREQHHDRRVQDGILRVGVQLLIKHFQRFAQEQESFLVSADILCRNINKVAARLDREFPGYGSCRMLHLLIPQP